jgi:two-component system invasion response regulator UvrY
MGETIGVKIKVLVLEDDPFTRLSLVAALSHFGYDVIIEEATAGAAVSRAKTAKPDAAVLDLHLGTGPTGIDVARELRKINPLVGLVVLTSFDDPRLLNPSLPPIPSGTVYLTKQSVSNLSELKAAVQTSLDNKAEGVEVQHVPAFGTLSDIQIEALRLVAQGLSNAEIAKRRFIKEKSVELTISRIAKSLGIESNISANQRVHIARVYFRAIGAKVDT